MSMLNHIKLEKREHLSYVTEVAFMLLALLLSFLVSAILIKASGSSVGDAMGALMKGAFGSPKAILETCIQATPLIFTGLAVLVAFKAKIWNIGVEGQLWMALIFATFVSLYMTFLPRALLLVTTIAAAMLGGALYAMLAAFMKNRFNANIVIVTIMMNYLVKFLVSYLLGGVWTDPEQHMLRTIRFDKATYIPTVLTSRFHIGFFVAILSAVILLILLERSSIGYEIKAIGENPVASGYKGIKIQRTIIIIMLISGALAGMAGVFEMNGLHHRLKMDISPGFGFTGILIAMLGRMNPLGVVAAAIFFGALTNGSVTMQIFTGVPAALVTSIQGIVLLFLLITEVASKYRLVRVRTC